MNKRSSSKALLAAYTALESEIEQAFDDRTSEGNYKRVLSRLSSWNSLRWFADFLEKGNTASIPDPMAREEYIVKVFGPLAKSPSIALVSGVGVVASALGVSSIVCPPGSMRDLGCDLFGYKIAGDRIDTAKGLGKIKTFLCLDKLLNGEMTGAGIADFLMPLANAMSAGTSLLFADKLAYQDDVVECLVMLDFEIELIESKADLDLVLIHALR